MMNLLKPNKDKLKAVLLIVLAIYLSNAVSDYITRLILPESLLTEVGNKPITEVLTQNFDEFIRIGYTIMIVRLLSTLTFVYLAVSVILRRKWLT